jgi:hypothetical protein
VPQDLRGVRTESLINKSQAKKSPDREIRAFFHKEENQLLDFAFFVDHVLANARVEHFLFELVRGSTLVLVGSVEVTSTGARDHSNQFTHDKAP